MPVESGIDPEKTYKLVEEIKRIRQEMTKILEEVNSDISGQINNSYQGAASTKLVATIRTKAPQLLQFLDNYVRTLSINMTQDIDAAKSLDKNLSFENERAM